jgi:hypothetical protein
MFTNWSPSPASSGVVSLNLFGRRSLVHHSRHPGILVIGNITSNCAVGRIQALSESWSCNTKGTRSACLEESIARCPQLVHSVQQGSLGLLLSLYRHSAIISFCLIIMLAYKIILAVSIWANLTINLYQAIAS